MNIQKVRGILTPRSLWALDVSQFEEIPIKLQSMGRPKFHAMMNALAECLEAGEIFLEVGSYQGGSMIGTLLNNQAPGWAVEDFSEFRGSVQVNNTRVALENNLQVFGVFDRVTIWEVDFRAFFRDAVIPPVGLYYYDACHSEEATLEGLELGFPHVVDGGLIVADDTNYPEVARGINRFIGSHPARLGTIFAVNPAAGPPGSLDADWWNGTIVIQKVKPE